MKTFKYFCLLSFLVVMNHSIIGQTFHYIIVGNNYYFPAEKTIQVGDTVRWINGVDGGGVHNVVADDGSFTSGPPAFPWTFDHIFTFAGLFPYHCSDHGSTGMTGTIIVQSTTEIKDDDFSLSKFVLFQNYPNPFNPGTTIRFKISESGFTSLKIYDVLGNEVATLVDEIKPAGSYEVEFSVGQSAAADSPDIASGIYFYQLRSGSNVQTKKLMLLK